MADECEHRCVENYRDDGAPTNLGDHEVDIPMPFAGDHEYRWGGKWGERTTNRDVDEERGNRRVLEGKRQIVTEKLLAQQERGNRHGGWFGDERAE